MVGAHGENGAHALKRVALEHSTAVGPARIQGLRMEGDSALEKTRRPGTVTQILAQVRMLFNQKNAHSKAMFTPYGIAFAPAFKAIPYSVNTAASSI